VASATTGRDCEPANGKAMTELLEQAFEEATNLPADEQDALARWMLAELRSERRWAEAFARSADELARLAGEALVERRAGRSHEPDSGSPQRR
jgi:hypothetical protein